MTTWLIAAAAALLALWPLLGEARRRPVSRRASQDPAGRHADLSGGCVYYRWHGPEAGPVAVCVHGLTTPSYVWDGLIPYLNEQGFRVLSFDLYGRGLSDRPRGVQDAEFFDAMLRALLDDQGVSGPVTLFGNSMGAAIATEFAARHPARIRQLVLLVPAGMGHDLGVGVRLTGGLPLLGDWLFHLVFPYSLRRGARAEADLPTSVPDIVSRQLDELRWRGFLRSVLSSVRAMLGRNCHDAHLALHGLDLPTLAVWGGGDEVIPIACRDRLSQWNPAAEHIVLPDAGHGLVYTHTAALWQRLGPALIRPDDLM
ncbi:alpha/beta fold hydrolase [Shimia sp.]|uniref:alpha/beta fold hydrolase n=1 Tax=Shimia sp. TaxID=1954381 RepID=UPI0035632984